MHGPFSESFYQANFTIYYRVTYGYSITNVPQMTHNVTEPETMWRQTKFLKFCLIIFSALIQPWPFWNTTSYNWLPEHIFHWFQMEERQKGWWAQFELRMWKDAARCHSAFGPMFYWFWQSSAWLQNDIWSTCFICRYD